MKYVLYAIVIIVFSFIAVPNSVLAEPTRTISVVGTAATKVSPDTVLWKITTSNTQKTLQKAKAKSDAQMKTILSSVKALGVVQKDMQTGYLNVKKMYNRDQHGNYNQFTGYRLTRDISIKQRNIALFDRFLSTLIGSDDIEVSYQLSSSDMHVTRAKTRLQSVEAAKKKASDMANVLGAKIGQPISLEEEPSAPFGHSYRNLNVLADGGINAVSTETFAPGTMDIQVSVKVVFELR